jgi:hypothetical protein
MTTDRARLEKAIVSAEECMAARVIGRREEMQILIDASRAHLDTLPRTKMQEVWHVEYVLGVVPGASVCLTRDEAERWASQLRSDQMDHLCVRVTGPHLHEMPST